MDTLPGIRTIAQAGSLLAPDEAARQRAQRWPTMAGRWASPENRTEPASSTDSTPMIQALQAIALRPVKPRTHGALTIPPKANGEMNSRTPRTTPTQSCHHIHVDIQLLLS